MDLRPVMGGIDRLAEAARPAAVGDWRNEQGLLMCGKCNAPLEYVIPKRAVKPFPEDTPPDKLKIMREVRDSIIGTKHRVMCKCAEAERTAYKRAEAAKALESRRGDCFGNHQILTKTTFSTDDGRSPELTATLRRYVSKFGEMRALGHGLILSGERDSGKSFNTLCIVNGVLTLGYRACYTSVYKIHTMTSPYISTQLVINSMLDADLIAIDDVNEDCFEGKNYNTLVALVNSAEARGIPLVIATRAVGADTAQIKALCRRVSMIQIKKGAP